MCWPSIARLQTDQARDGLVEINDAALLVHHQHAVLNRVEQRFEKTAFARQPLDDRLQTFRVQPPDAAKHFVEKTGFGHRHCMNANNSPFKMACHLGTF